MKDIDNIFNNFQNWADNIINQYGGKKIHYSLEDFNGFCPTYLGQDFGFGFGALPTVKNGNIRQDYVPFVIQQIKEEIYSFVEILLQYNKLESMIEIGLGDFGGTRRLWIEIFKEVYTIEPRHDLINRYISNTPEDNEAKIICAYSPNFILDKQFDCCFIDGDHTYESAQRDYQKLEPYIKSGGIIAFHDSRRNGIGCAEFIHSLKNTFDIKDIQHPDAFGAGISYYVKE